ncbi:hypothetical protein JTB14_002323 [Gonioctena quinquepunctata]|nr:hypothetical protein JTB14_002323 [Gonioctena quinquepunctata]
MTTWTEREISVIQEYLTKKEGPITTENHSVIRQTPTNSAKKYLTKFIGRILQGKEPGRNRCDSKCYTNLQKGEETDPANCRPIPLLNIEYKILTGTITEVLKKDLKEWAIPKEQLARQKTWHAPGQGSHTIGKNEKEKAFLSLNTFQPIHINRTTNTKQSMKLITNELKKASAEVGLALNEGKCGIYTRNGMQFQEEEDDTLFLPEVREGYTYFG